MVLSWPACIQPSGMRLLKLYQASSIPTRWTPVRIPEPWRKGLDTSRVCWVCLQLSTTGFRRYIRTVCQGCSLVYRGWIWIGQVASQHGQLAPGGCNIHVRYTARSVAVLRTHCSPSVRQGSEGCRRHRSEFHAQSGILHGALLRTFRALQFRPRRFGT